MAKENPTLQAYSELQQAFDFYNRNLFDGLLPRCMITMQREKQTYGYFSFKRFVHREDSTVTDEIAMNPTYFGVVPLLEILQTLVHEMVHAWQYHFGEPGRRRYHNREWADKMEAVGLMPSSTGHPGGARTGERIADYPIRDGKFMQATGELLASGFQVSWLDRYPPVDPEAITLPEVSTAVTGSHAEQAVGASPGFTKLLVAPVLENRSNRVKYRCPDCLAQVWGKPGLHILCNNTGCEAVPFEAV